MGGLVGVLAGVAVILTLLGYTTLGLVVAAGMGSMLGDLFESMVKRVTGVKNTGDWLPGFGDLLNRVDPLPLVLPLAAVPG